MIRKAATVFLVVAALLLVAGLTAVLANMPFNPTFDILTVSPPTPGANGDIARRVTVPAGNHLPAIETIAAPAGWDIAADRDIPDGDAVGYGTLTVNQGACPGTPVEFSFTIQDAPAERGDKAYWRAILNPTLVLSFVITGSASSGHTVQALMFYDENVHGPYCAPMDLTIVHNGVSGSGAPVLTNPSVQGLYAWSAVYRPAPLPPVHPDVTVDDTVAIGADGDGDSVPDFVDNCPGVANGPNQAGVPYVGNQSDTDGDSVGDACDDDDGDGWRDVIEILFLGTDPALCCSYTGTPDDEDPDPCPPDSNDDQIVRINDVFFVANRFNALAGNSSYTPRAEIASQNGAIGIDDVFAVAGRFNQPC